MPACIQEESFCSTALPFSVASALCPETAQTHPARGYLERRTSLVAVCYCHLQAHTMGDLERVVGLVGSYWTLQGIVMVASPGCISMPNTRALLTCVETL